MPFTFLCCLFLIRFHYAARTWESIKKSSLMSEFNRLLSWCLTFDPPPCGCVMIQIKKSSLMSEFNCQLSWWCLTFDPLPLAGVMIQTMDLQCHQVILGLNFTVKSPKGYLSMRPWGHYINLLRPWGRYINLLSKLGCIVHRFKGILKKNNKKDKK